MIICRGTNETDGRTDGRTDGQLFTPHSGISSHSKGARIQIGCSKCNRSIVNKTNTNLLHSNSIHSISRKKHDYNFVFRS